MAGLSQTPSGERIQIAIFGRRNAGKSSLLNRLTNQSISIVSDVKGTTTDPVYKAMEILPLGPVMLVDTPGLDDEGTLGNMRVEKAEKVLQKTHVAMVVMDCVSAEETGLEKEEQILKKIKEKHIPYILIVNKIDETSEDTLAEVIRKIENYKENDSTNVVSVSAKTGEGISDLMKELVAMTKVLEQTEEKHIISDKLEPGDIAVLVVPIDESAPKGRLILPQQQTIREILDADAVAMVCKDTDLELTLQSLGKKPKVVITDSQVFGKVSKIVPEDVLLTSFSILFARYKGNLDVLVRGVTALEGLQDGDTVLIAEGCTHRRQCGDIGTVKIPTWIRSYTSKQIHIETCSGGDFPEDLEKYALVVHCGGCTLNQREMLYRMELAVKKKVPIVNYGILIAYIHGILGKSLEIFPETRELLDKTQE